MLLYNLSESMCTLNSFRHAMSKAAPKTPTHSNTQELKGFFVWFRASLWAFASQISPAEDNRRVETIRIAQSISVRKAANRIFPLIRPYFGGIFSPDDWRPVF